MAREATQTELIRVVTRAPRDWERFTWALSNELTAAGWQTVVTGERVRAADVIDREGGR